MFAGQTLLSPTEGRGPEALHAKRFRVHGREIQIVNHASDLSQRTIAKPRFQTRQFWKRDLACYRQPRNDTIDSSKLADL
jgi:hypothetical protein